MNKEKEGVARPVDEKIIEVGEYKVNVASAGTGHAIVLLHGEESRPSWKEWDDLLGLADKYRLIIPDLVGLLMGRAVLDRGGYRLA